VSERADLFQAKQKIFEAADFESLTAADDLRGLSWILKKVREAYDSSKQIRGAHEETGATREEAQSV
jgi:hypothetical protein